MSSSAIYAWQNWLVIENVTLLELRMLRQVAADGSFATAASELGYTQSAVSRQMAALERAVGETLFERGRRGVVLTPAAEIVLRGAGRALAELETTTQQLAGLRDRVAGRLSMGAFPSACAALLPRAVAALRADHPALQVVIDEAATPVLLRRLRAGRLDLAVVVVGTVFADHDISGLSEHALPTVGLRIAVPVEHRLARRGTIQVHDLADERWIAGVGAPGEPQFGAWPNVKNPRIAHSVRHWSTRLGLVAAGQGISVLPGTMTFAVPAGVRVLTVDDPSQTGRSSVLVTRPDPGRYTDLAVQMVIQQAGALRAFAG